MLRIAGMSLRLKTGALVASVLLSACTMLPMKNGQSEEIIQLKQIADHWDQAIVAKNRAGIEQNMSEDFRQIDGEGNLEDKRSFVEGLLDPALHIDPYKVEDFEVRVYGDVALVSGRTRMTGHYASKPFSTHYRYIDVYVRREGTWKIVSVQISKLTQ